MKFSLLAVAVALVMGSNALAQSDNPGKFTALDVFNLEYATDPQPSADGSEIVYVRRSNDIMTDRTRSNIWSVKADGSENRPLLSGRDNYSSPRWSPDGTKIAYTSAAEGSNQIYLRWHDSGQTALLSNLTLSPGGLTWSPDGKWLAFSARVAVKNPTLAKAPPKPEGANWAEPMHIIDAVRSSSRQTAEHRARSPAAILIMAGRFHGLRTAQIFFFQATFMKTGNLKHRKVIFFRSRLMMEPLARLPVSPVLNARRYILLMAA